MSQMLHTLEIYEPYEYKGQNPLATVGLGVLAGPAGTRYYLLSLSKPLTVDNETVEQLLVQCRYSEDHYSRPTHSMCTVNINRPRAGLNLQADSAISFSDIVRWGVGKISPCNFE